MEKRIVFPAAVQALLKKPIHVVHSSRNMRGIATAAALRNASPSVVGLGRRRKKDDQKKEEIKCRLLLLLLDDAAAACLRLFILSGLSLSW